MDLKEYISSINLQYQTGVAREHAYRPALQQLLSSLMPFAIVTNEPARVACGAPDYIVTDKKTSLPIAFFEAKDIDDSDLDGRKSHKEQFSRYKSSLDTIVFTDYLDFHLYESGEWVENVRIGEIHGNKIVLVKENEAKFLELISHVGSAHPQKITSASKLAAIMASKARLLSETVKKSFSDENNSYDNRQLQGQYEAFKKVLIHDLTTNAFSDIYAQTIAYGMFAARLHDDSPDDFSRAEAANLIPKTNPFLRKIFQQIAGYDLDERIAWIVDDLVSAFAATDMEKIMQGFGKSTQQTDPMLHFYEDFLFQYDPAAKKQCGVYYTPQPVVEFIVRAVDDILRTEFNLPMGLADTSKVEIEQEIEQDLKHRKEKKLVHRVQVLDPATGTGTFLAETVRQIKRDLGGQMGAWASYVPEHLLPRLHGFELMMAPYTIAHLKLDLEIGITAQDRLRIFLTNSLEEANPDANTLFGHYLAEEANKASKIKQSAPVMIVMGNPPYSISSNNKGEWITKLLDDYKKNLNERNIQPLSDDYIKFVRLAQYYVERNGEGVLAYICNNSFIDGLIHRQMRSELMRVFDKIYILDLHGNTRKKETAPDGSKDENVFDIMQGVSINIFVKKSGKSKAPAEVRHFDLYGLREYKYEYLRTHNLASVEWKNLNPQTPSFFFVPKDFGVQKEYEKGFGVNELMKVGACGIVSSRDSLLVKNSKSELKEVESDFINLQEDEFRKKYNIADSRDWTYISAKEDIKNSVIIQISYRPFDNQFVFYSHKSKGILSYPRYEIMRHIIGQKNIVLNVCKQQSTFDFQHILVSEYITDKCTISSQTKEAGYVFPLYLYPEPGSIDSSRHPNLDEHIWAQINAAIGKDTAPEDIFDYIYGVLHSPAYRARYKEFLKVDFPRIPYPKDQTEFEHFRSFGNRFRELHLMHSVPESPVTFPESGSMSVEKVEFTSSAAPGVSAADTAPIAPELNAGRVYINATQYFANVARTAWEFYIGGYQPAQKWLKDRKGRTLSFDDISHYGKIISVLTETARLMTEIDNTP